MDEINNEIGSFEFSDNENDTINCQYKDCIQTSDIAIFIKCQGCKRSYCTPHINMDNHSCKNIKFTMKEIAISNNYWECKKCTFINAPSSKKCMVCELFNSNNTLVNNNNNDIEDICPYCTKSVSHFLYEIHLKICEKKFTNRKQKTSNSILDEITCPYCKRAVYQCTFDYHIQKCLRKHIINDKSDKINQHKSDDTDNDIDMIEDNNHNDVISFPCNKCDAYISYKVYDFHITWCKGEKIKKDTCPLCNKGISEQIYEQHINECCEKQKEKDKKEECELLSHASMCSIENDINDTDDDYDIIDDDKGEMENNTHMGDDITQSAENKLIDYHNMWAYKSYKAVKSQLTVKTSRDFLAMFYYGMKSHFVENKTDFENDELLQLTADVFHLTVPQITLQLEIHKIEMRKWMEREKPNHRTSLATGIVEIDNILPTQNEVLISLPYSFITIDLQTELKKLFKLNKSKKYHFIKVFRTKISNENGTESLALNIIFLPSVSQCSIKFHALACLIHAMQSGSVMNENDAFLHRIGRSVARANVISQTKFIDDELTLLGEILDELNNRENLINISKESNKYLLSLNNGTNPTPNQLKHLTALQNNSSLDFDHLYDFKKQEKSWKNMSSMEHISTCEKSLEDTDICHKFFSPIFQELNHRGYSFSFILNTKEYGAHWVTKLFSGVPQGLVLFGTNSNLNATDHDIISMSIRISNCMITGYGMIGSQEGLKDFADSFSVLRQNLNCIDCFSNNYEQMIGDDMNQLLFYSDDWKKQLHEDVKINDNEIYSVQKSMYLTSHSLLAHLTCATDTPQYIAAIARIKQYYDDISTLNKEWKVNCSDFKSLHEVVDSILPTNKDYMTLNNIWLTEITMSTIPSYLYGYVRVNIDENVLKIIQNKCLNMVKSRVKEQIDLNKIKSSIVDLFTGDVKRKTYLLINNVYNFIINTDMIIDNILETNATEYMNEILDFQSLINETVTLIKDTAFAMG
eukprot:30567_1